MTEFIGHFNSYKKLPENPQYGSLAFNLEDNHMYVYIDEWEKGYNCYNLFIVESVFDKILNTLEKAQSPLKDKIEEIIKKYKSM